jgi:peptidoglycan/xylan/chitin deacetylase (PgdA/CDA1 family)
MVSPMESRGAHWDRIFSRPDPFNWACDFEQTKYRRTLDIVPSDSLERVLEIGCAEGMFTKQLARFAKTLLAADISALALARAQNRCADCANVSFRLLDIVADDIPGRQTLIICSEVLYYLEQERLAPIAEKLRDALEPGGRLVMANSFVLKDDMSSTGFDWEHYGGKVVHETFATISGLTLERSIITELYRIDCFKKCEAQEIPRPHIERVNLGCEPETSLLQQIVWGGAWERRTDLAKRVRTWEVPVLAYHRIAEDGPISLRHWRVHPELFRQQLRLLRAHGYHSVTSAELQMAIDSGTPLPGRPVLITFDDGYQDFADVAWPILEAEGFSAEVFVVTDLVGTVTSWDAYDGKPAPLMDWDTIKKLHKSGVCFGSHLATHTPATNLSSEDMLREISSSRAELEAHLNTPVLSMAAPYDATDERYNRLLASSGYQIGFAGDRRSADIRHERFAMPRLQIEGDWNLSEFAKAMDLSSTMPGQDQKVGVKYDELVVRYRRAFLYRDLGNLEAARADLERALELRPNDPSTLLMPIKGVEEKITEIREMIDRCQYQDAAVQLSDLVTVLPKDPELNYLFALCLHIQNKDLKLAMKHYDLALQYGFDEFWVKYNRGSLYEKLGNTEQAEADLMRAVELKPKHQGAQQILQHLPVQR